jgi:hypothetical protein
MPVTDKHVSVTKRAAFLVLFTTKVETLERLAPEEVRERLPKLTPTAFIRWSQAELDVCRISRDGFYKKEPEHSALRVRVKTVLKNVRAQRSDRPREENALAKLQEELAEALSQRDMAETLAVSAKAELRAARARIAALESQLGRAASKGRNVLPFTPARKPEQPRQ